ncbi:MAG: hypothetical protein LBB79_04730 [Prevotellaceae bacterium]|jgi:hypothetical protein|nr:hypothetical protein [Prevotellaceae bacterium]
MRKILFILVLLHYGCSNASHCGLQVGDLLFQSGNGSLSRAIKEVTKGADGRSFSHVGMVAADSGGRLWVVEAAGGGVQLTPVDSFTRRGAVAAAGRVKEAYKPLIPDAVAFAVRQTGTPYDSAYLYSNGMYYCSELIYDAFLYANCGTPFFSLEPMTFKVPATGEFSAGWTAHYEKLHIPVPEGEPGCNPGGLSRSEKIELWEFSADN